MLVVGFLGDFSRMYSPTELILILNGREIRSDLLNVNGIIRVGTKFFPNIFISFPRLRISVGLLIFFEYAWEHSE